MIVRQRRAERTAHAARAAVMRQEADDAVAVAIDRDARVLAHDADGLGEVRAQQGISEGRLGGDQRFPDGDSSAARSEGWTVRAFSIGSAAQSGDKPCPGKGFPLDQASSGRALTAEYRRENLFEPAGVRVVKGRGTVGIDVKHRDQRTVARENRDHNLAL